jgi:hypothetical protein
VLGRADFAPTPEDDAAWPFEGALVVPRFATDGVFEPPQPPAARASSVRTAPSTSVSFTQSRKAERSKTALKQL